MTSRPLHPGYRAARMWAGLLAAAAAVLPPSVTAQAVRDRGEPLPEPVDSTDARGAARNAQARFERLRARHLPALRFPGGGDCDEVVGRFCTTYDEGEWRPEPEAGEVAALRAALLAVLDSVQEVLPGDGWVLGQRVWYRGEAGRWDEALADARACGGAERWWCAALEGLALHGLGRYPEAREAFERALDAMDAERARRWREPRRALAGDVRDLLDDEAPPARDALLARLWRLADPLYLVPGNDRETEHYARWAVSTLREGARNPYQVAWGRDLEELTIRHGWEMGWELRPARDLSARDDVVGHKHPEGRDFLPTGRALRDPAGAPPEDLRADLGRPRSLYAPAYAPVLLPMEGQVAVFPRGGRMVVVATHFLPDDTTGHVGHDHARPWMEPGDQAGAPDRAGLFLLPPHGGGVRSALGTGTEGVLTLDAPAGGWVLSVEAWSAALRRAGRFRRGVRRDTVPPDVATLSDLLLVRGGPAEPRSLVEVAPRALLRPEIGPRDPVAVVWEVNGLGWRSEEVRYELQVERAGRGLLRRLVEGLGLADRERALSLSWSEPGPGRPGAVLRRVELALPELEPGSYRVRLRARVSGRGALEAGTALRVLASLVDDEPRPL